MYSPQSGSLRDVHGVTQRREEGIRRQRSQEDKRGNQKERDNLVSNQVPQCSPQPRTHRDSPRWVEKRWGREEIEMTWGRKEKVKRGESNQVNNHTPK